MIRSHLLAVITALVSITSCQLYAAPYSTNVLVSGTSVSFILNEPADTLLYRVNSGAWQPLDGSSKGTKSFSLGAATDTFSIVAGKNDPLGYTIPTGGAAVAATAAGLGQATNPGGYNLISNDTDPLSRYNQPRGVNVSTNPNAPNFGTTYISNSAAGSTLASSGSGVIRALTDGMYAVRADQSDAFGQGNTARNPGGVFVASSSTPWRNVVGPDGQVYVADWTDSNGNVYMLNPDLTTATNTLNGIGGPSAVPATQKHGSVQALYVEGSLANGDLVLYTIDEDLTELTGTGSGNNTIKNNLWRYNIGGSIPAGGFTGAPTKINGAGSFLINATDDVQRGADGKFYVSQLRSNGTDVGSVYVLDASGTIVFNSLTETRTLLADNLAADILRNTQGLAVSPDQKWLATVLTNSDIAVIPLINGIPDLANRLHINSASPDTNTGTDIAFDAAGNLHYVSRGQEMYRVLSPGGVTYARTDFDGTNYSFAIGSTAIPEPSAMVLAGLALLGLAGLARRR